MVLRTLRKKIIVNIPSIEFVCFRGKQSIFGDSLKHLSGTFQFAPLQYLLERDYPQTKNIIYEVAKLFGSYIYMSYYSVLKKKSPKLIYYCFEEMMNMGLGKPELIQGLGSRVLIRLKNSPFSEYIRKLTTAKVPRDHIQAGMFAGIFSEHTNKNYDFEETSCAAFSSKECSFQGKPSLEKFESEFSKYFLEDAFNFQGKEYIESKNKMVDRIAKSTGITLKDGKLRLFNVTITLYPLAFFHILQKALAKRNIPVEEYVFHATIMQSMRACGYQEDKFGVKDKKEIISKVLEQWEMIGVGKLTLDENSTEQKGLIKIDNFHWFGVYKSLFKKIDVIAKAQVLGAVLGIYYYVFKDAGYIVSIDDLHKEISVSKSKEKQEISFNKSLLDDFLELTKPKYFN